MIPVPGKVVEINTLAFTTGTLGMRVSKKGGGNGTTIVDDSLLITRNKGWLDHSVQHTGLLRVTVIAIGIQRTTGGDIHRGI